MIVFELFAWVLARILGLVKVLDGPEGTRIVIVRRLIPSWAGAQTWGRVILVAEGQDWRLHWPHEFVHVLQWRRWGALFPLAYLGASLWVWLQGKHPYRDNPFEAQAQREASRYAHLVEVVS